MVKDHSYITINSLNPLHLINSKINGCVKESYGNKCLTLVPPDGRKQTLKNMKDYGTKLEI